MPSVSKFLSIAEYEKTNSKDDDDEDEDDYEPMQPGVFSASAAKWEEQMAIGNQLNCQIPKPHNIRTGGDTRPIQYADVILPSRPNEKPSIVSSPVPPVAHSGTTTPTPTPTPTPTAEVAPVEFSVRRHRLSSNKDMAATAADAATKVVSKRWTRALSEDELARQPIVARQKWAKPQGANIRTNSNQLNNNWPRAYAKTGKWMMDDLWASTLTGLIFVEAVWVEKRGGGGANEVPGIVQACFAFAAKQVPLLLTFLYEIINI